MLTFFESRRESSDYAEIQLVLAFLALQTEEKGDLCDISLDRPIALQDRL
jgi:hypothetical protein